MLSRDLSVYNMIKSQAQRWPNAIAIGAPGRVPLTYSRLLTQVERTVETLNAMGLGRGDRIAIVLPNGPEMAVALLAVAAGSTCAPLNPAYRATELDFSLSDLNVSALIVSPAVDQVASSVARSRGIRVITLSPVSQAEAGLFVFEGEEGAKGTGGSFTQPDDVALVLHTSGTTSRPKIVPLTQANICTSAHNTRTALHLTESDRCLNIMPLFHIHGLVGALLSSLAAGASVICTPGFYAPKFLQWMDDFRPTWYTAVPTMHQSILQRAKANREVAARCPLRFIRSCSSALPTRVMEEMQEVFNTPVIEAYGMTEASHQMASNPLPPRQRKPGSVGLAAGPEIAIMDEQGNLLPVGEVGEIVIRGANVTAGYENNPTANQSAFTAGWFRTGDQGYLDVDGYLFIKGRIKEIINRGGEKISPGEIDETLMEHPAIAQAITFAVPDNRLGEEVAAAVVPRPGATVTEREIREFAARRLSDFKVPSQVLIVDEIPKGPTGKPRRIGLAELLGLTQTKAAPSHSTTPFVPPRTDLEIMLARLWSEVLGIERIGINDNFLQLGGESILATRIVARLRQTLDVELSLVTFFENPTVAGLAAIVEELVLDQIERLSAEEAQSMIEQQITTG